jgi:hypothetical protein
LSITGVLAAVLGMSFAAQCANPEDEISNNTPAQVWKGNPGNMVYLGVAPLGSGACLDQIVNEVWAANIPEGMTAVTFNLGLRKYAGLVREAEWHRGSLPVAQTSHPSGFVRPMSKVEEGNSEKFSFETAPPTDEENGP